MTTCVISCLRHIFWGNIFSFIFKWFVSYFQAMAITVNFDVDLASIILGKWTAMSLYGYKWMFCFRDKLKLVRYDEFVYVILSARGERKRRRRRKRKRRRRNGNSTKLKSTPFLKIITRSRTYMFMIRHASRWSYVYKGHLDSNLDSNLEERQSIKKTVKVQNSWKKVGARKFRGKFRGPMLKEWFNGQRVRLKKEHNGRRRKDGERGGKIGSKERKRRGRERGVERGERA